MNPELHVGDCPVGCDSQARYLIKPLGSQLHDVRVCGVHLGERIQDVLDFTRGDADPAVTVEDDDEMGDLE